MEKQATSEYVKVSSIGLEKLVKDVIQLKQFLSKVELTFWMFDSIFIEYICTYVLV
jgi:hypothetical protein